MDNNVDNILVPREQAILANQQIPPQPAKEHLEPPQEPKLSEPVIEHVEKTSAPEPAVAQEEIDTELAQAVAEPEVKKDSPIDEYGNPVEKPKMYTEDEVQRMIRDRLSRGRHAEQPTQQQVKQAAKEFEHDPNNPADWQKQLDEYIDNRIETREKEITEKSWREQEQARQAEFESKFTTGMQKYQDFESVVRGKSITPGMMMAMRALDNPASFVYAAAKLHAPELARIAQISDTAVQAAEIGRLHERMVKARNTNSKAPVPLTPPKSDVPAKSNDFGSIESRIDQYAKQKRK